MNWKDILTRALWTFLEGFLVALPAFDQMGIDGGAWSAGLLAAGMAGLSALKTFVLEILKNRTK